MPALPRPLRPLLIALVLTASACSTSGEEARTTALRAELDTALERQRQLTDRVADLEEALAPAAGATEDPLADLDERFAALDQQLEDLLSQLEAEVSARGSAVTTLAEDVDTLDQRLVEVQAGMAELRGAVQELTDELASLEAQFRAHRDDDASHN